MAAAATFELTSPDGKTTATVTHDESAGSLSYKVTSGGAAIIEDSPLGILTDKADFTAGLVFAESAKSRVDETYTLPQGKVSTYVNRANQLVLRFSKDAQTFNVVVRAYDDGVAFRYGIPGNGDIAISGEHTGFRLPGQPVYWGQGHPNRYGYEDDLEQVKGPAFSLALLCELETPKRWVLLAQAATYGNYCIPHLKDESGLLRVQFPLDQKEPVKTKLPFESPWRVIVVSPEDLSVIVEQTLFENLNPPTEPDLQNATWIKPGRSSWDWFAKDKKNIRGWTDFVAEMGWEYHLIDDGWERYVGDIPAVVEYARGKGVGIMVWKRTGAVQTPEAMHACFKEYAAHGFKGAKVDFFDRLPKGKHSDDYEDTQMGLQVRDNLCQIAAEYKIQLVFHGCAIPTGERRRWPHLLGTEAVKGQEGSPQVPHDNCIAYVRNPLGPVDYSPVWFGKGNKTDAYQLSTAVVFESGFLIFADLHKDYLNHPSKEFLKRVPATWDEVKFVEGYPASHTVIARRKGDEWYVGGMTVNARTVDMSLEFLKGKGSYRATIFKDQESGLPLAVETMELKSSDTLKLKMQDKGGFVVHLAPAAGPQ